MTIFSTDFGLIALVTLACLVICAYALYRVWKVWPHMPANGGKPASQARWRLSHRGEDRQGGRI
jgi:hypothetical protein